MKQAIKPDDAAAMIPDGATLLIGGFMAVGSPHRLIEAITLVRAVQSFLRLTAGDRFVEETASEGLKASLAEAAGCADFAALKDRLIATAQGALEIYQELIESPAAEARSRLRSETPSS